MEFLHNKEESLIDKVTSFTESAKHICAEFLTLPSFVLLKDQSLLEGVSTFIRETPFLLVNPFHHETDFFYIYRKP